VILPFEEEYFRSRGIPADFVGHPLMDDLQEKYGRDLPPSPSEEPPVLGLLPGSRKQEIVSTLPHTIRAIRRIRERGETFRIVASAARPGFKEMLEAELAPLGLPFEILEKQTGEIFRQSRLALVTSGTTSLEGIFHGTPMVVIYRIPALSYLAAQPWRLLPHIALPNILAGEEIVPEFLIWRGGDTRFSDAAVRAFTDAETRDAMRQKVLGVRSTLVDRPDASEAAARRVLELIRTAC
jgi:lipid-A-disaccharide synthase